MTTTSSSVFSSAMATRLRHLVARDPGVAVADLMAADRRHELVRPAPQRDRPALARRSGQPLARRHRQMDPRERRGAARRQPFAYFHWPAMDRQGMAIADPVGAGRARRRMGCRRRAFSSFDRGDLRPDAAAAAARPSPAAGAVVHRRRDRPERPALPGAPARFRLSLHGAVGRGPGARQSSRDARRGRCCCWRCCCGPTCMAASRSA